MRELRLSEEFFDGVFMVGGGDDEDDVSGRFGSMNWKADDDVDD